MKKFIPYTLIIALCSTSMVKAQENQKKIKDYVDLYGYIRNDVMFDTRQTVNVREGAVLMWGADINTDINGKDINSASKFQMLSVLTRAGLRFSAPDIMNAKIKGMIEGDFFGNASSGINEFRLRHAWLTMDWENTQIGIGQYWHPLTVPDVFPETVNFSGGAPYMPLNRNPQIRLTQKLSNKVKLIVVALSQRDFTLNTAPYINSGVPALNAQLQFKSGNFLIGADAHFEHIRPKISSGTNNLYTNERLNSFTGMLFSKFITKPVTIKAEATWAQNGASFLMLGGFVGYTADDGSIETYSTMNTEAYWIDISGNGKKWVPGFFAGYSRNNGTTASMEGPHITAQAYGFPAAVTGIGAGAGARTINHIYRIAPRINYLAGRMKFGFEPEYSLAQWGDANNSGQADSHTDNVKHLRIIFATTLTF